MKNYMAHLESKCNAFGCKPQKSFIQSVSPLDTESSHQYAAVDSFAHAFAKEFGAHGTPEYGAGGVTDFSTCKILKTSTIKNGYRYT